MDELATQAHSSGEAAANIAEQLAKRITNTNPVVKYKVRGPHADA